MSSALKGQDVPPGERIGPYHLAAELEQGSLGPLFGARVTSSAEEGRLVLVRRLSTVVCAPRQAERMVEAARVAANVRHAKLAAVLDTIVSEQEIAVVGEYVEGPTLSLLQRLAFEKRSPLPPAVALRVGVDLLHALRAARDEWRKCAPQALQRALHGGLLPENIFIAAFGEVLLGEVGFAAVASGLEPFRTLPGIVAYRGPEQLSAGASFELSERADVFSVGVVLWELLANRPLFGDPERLRAGVAPSGHPATAQTLRDLQSKLIPPLGAIERAGAPVPRAAAEIVERALRRDPATRYATLDQMLGALLALGREVVATSDQVATAIERLARSEFDAQRAALEPMSGNFPSSRPSGLPDSGRPTHKPDPPAEPSPPSGGFDRQSPVVEQFSQHEAPTFPTAQLARAVSVQPPPLPRRKPAVPTSSAPPAFGTPLPPLPPLPELPELERPALAPPALPADVVALEPGAAAATGSRARARKVALVIGGTVALIGLSALLRAVASSPKPETASPPAPSPVRSSEAPPLTRSAESPPVHTPPFAAAAAPAERTGPEARPKAVATEAPSRAEPVRAGPAPLAPGDANRAAPRPDAQKKAFRPKGI